MVLRRIFIIAYSRRIMLALPRLMAAAAEPWSLVRIQPQSLSIAHLVETTLKPAGQFTIQTILTLFFTIRLCGRIDLAFQAPWRVLLWFPLTVHQQVIFLLLFKIWTFLLPMTI